MATRQPTRTSKKTTPASRKAPAKTASSKPKSASSASAAARRSQAPAGAPATRKTAARRAASTAKAVPVPAKPASMTGPLPPIVTLKHLAEWAGYNHGVPKKQAIEMFSGFVEDIGRVLKNGSKIRIPNLGILQVRLRPGRPARTGRNPRTGEEIRIKASRPSKRVAFRVAKTLKEKV
jgi:DNA-binding protein HU-beta